MLLDRLTRELGPFRENDRAAIARQIGGNLAQEAQRQFVAARTAGFIGGGGEARAVWRQTVVAK